MRDTLDERLTQLAGSLEAAAEVRSPVAVRSRGEQIRVAHRRRIAAGTAVSAAVVVLGVGSLVALRPADGHRGASVNPGTAAPSSTPSTPSSASTAATSATHAAARPAVLIDLKQDTMTVYDDRGQVVKNMPVTGGSAKHPSPLGVFTITAKQQQVKIQNGTYDLMVDWAITLDKGPSLYAASWSSTSQGKQNQTHGDIEMSDESARWLYNHVAIGDRVQIQ